jgi:hypothetical protein
MTKAKSQLWCVSSQVLNLRMFSFSGVAVMSENSIARLKASAHGHSSGVRSVGRTGATDETARDPQEPGADGAGHGEVVSGARTGRSRISRGDSSRSQLPSGNPPRGEITG